MSNNYRHDVSLAVAPRRFVHGWGLRTWTSSPNAPPRWRRHGNAGQSPQSSSAVVSWASSDRVDAFDALRPVPTPCQPLLSWKLAPSKTEHTSSACQKHQNAWFTKALAHQCFSNKNSERALQLRYPSIRWCLATSEPKLHRNAVEVTDLKHSA